MRWVLNFGMIFFSLCSFSALSFAQYLPVGMYEGFLGNSGTALTDSKAASFYNPSLLKEKQDSSFSIGGTTFSSYKINSAFGDSRNTTFSPSYLGSVIVGTNLVHEFFYWTTGEIKQSLSQESAFLNVNYDYTQTDSAVGYSMAFRSVSLALQYGLQYNQGKYDVFRIEKDSVNNLTRSSQTRSLVQGANFLLGISTHQRFGGYSFGFQVQPNRLKLYQDNKMITKSTLHSGGVITDSTVETDAEQSLPGAMFRAGHSFRTQNHEFLTDTILIERASLTDAYSARQSFGYRFIASENWEYFCGFNRGIGKDSLSFSNDQYLSTGFSWRTRASRTAIGFYHSKYETEVLFESTGLNFSTEFTY